MTRIRSSTLCTALECDSSRRTRCGSASIAPLPNIASNEARIAAAPSRRAPPGWTQQISSSSDQTRHQALDVAARIAS